MTEVLSLGKSIHSLPGIPPFVQSITASICTDDFPLQPHPSSNSLPPANTPSNLSRHLHTRLGGQNILASPKTRHRLRLRIEPNTRFPIKRIRPTARHALLVAREAEHGQGHRDRDVDADLAGFDVLLEARGGAAGAGEDGDAVAVFVGVDEGDSVLDRGDVDTDEDGAEDLLGVASHVGFHVGDDRGADLGICGQYEMEYHY